MSNNEEFPASHTTSTTTKVTPIIWFDSSYIKTTSGLLKSIVIAVNLIGFICASIGGKRTASVSFYCVTSMFAFWITLILLAMYLFHFIEKYHSIPWLFIELLYCAAWTILYLFASLFITLVGGVYAAAGIFGFLAMCLYGMDAYMKYRAYRGGEIAQGERTNSSAATAAAGAQSQPKSAA